MILTDRHEPDTEKYALTNRHTHVVKEGLTKKTLEKLPSNNPQFPKFKTFPVILTDHKLKTKSQVVFCLESLCINNNNMTFSNSHILMCQHNFPTNISCGLTSDEL